MFISRFVVKLSTEDILVYEKMASFMNKNLHILHSTERNDHTLYQKINLIVI